MRRSSHLLEGVTDRLVDDACVLLGAWAVCAQLVVFAGGTLYHLLAAFLLLLPVLVALWRRVRRRSPGPLTTASRALPYASGTVLTAVEVGGVILAVLSCGAFFSGRPIAAWWLIAGAGGLGLVTLGGTYRIRLAPVRIHARHELLLCALAATIGLAALFAHRFNFDDSLYVHVAVAAVDRPDVALLSEDTIHSLPGVPLRLPAHKVRAYELLAAAVALSTGLPPIHVFHLVAAFVAALLVPLAWAKLFRLLTPRSWLLATLLVLAIYLGVGETNRWYSNFAIVRMWHGKSIFLAVFLPAILAYGIEFAAKPSRRRAFLLLAAQCAAVGVTSTALWVAPFVAGLGMLRGIGRARDSLRVLSIGGLTSAFAIITALIARLEVGRMAQGLRMRTTEVIPADAMLSEVLTLVFGEGRLLGLMLVLLSCGWICAARGTMARKFAVVTSFVPMFVLLNPYAVGVVRGNVTGPDYWRTLWAIPVPALIVLALASPLRGHVTPSRVPRRTIAVLALTASFLLAVPTYSAVGARNLVDWRLPSLKVDAEGYPLAARINERVPEGSYVIAPTIASTWIPTFPRHAYPLQVRDYMTLPLRLEDRRLWTVEFADGSVRSPQRIRRFEEALRAYTIRAVCLRVKDEMREIHRILRSRGFDRSFNAADWEIWVRRRVPAAVALPQRPP